MYDRKDVPPGERECESVKAGLIDVAQPDPESAAAPLLFDHHRVAPVLGRREDVWRTNSGEVVYPRDVEETINELPEVNEVAVVAVENQPVAFIRVDHHDEQLTPQMVLAFCRRRLRASHWPQAVIFVEEFPRNEVGRIVRDALVREHAAQVKAGLCEQGLDAVVG